MFGKIWRISVLPKKTWLLLTLFVSFLFAVTMPTLADFDKSKVKSMEKFLEAEKKAKKKVYNELKDSEKKTSSSKDKNKTGHSNKFLSIFEKIELMLENFKTRYNVFLDEKIVLQPFLLPEEVLVHQDGEKTRYDFKSSPKNKKLKDFSDYVKSLQKLAEAKTPKTPEQIYAEIEQLKKQVKFHSDFAGLKVVKGFAGENTFSFQLLKNPELYLCIDGEGKSDKFTWKKLAFKKIESNDSWKKGASFNITGGKAFAKWMSIESLAFPGWFVSLEPEKFTALPEDFKNLEDVLKFTDQQKKSSLVLIEFAEKRLHRLLTTFRFVSFAPSNDFAKFLAERDMQENPDLGREVLEDIGLRMVALSEAKKKFSDKKKMREEILAKREEEKKEKRKAKEEELKKKAAEIARKIGEKVKKLKAEAKEAKEKSAKGDPKKIVTRSGVNLDVARTGKSLDLDTVLAMAIGEEILPDDFQFGYLPIDIVELRDYTLEIRSDELNVEGTAYSLGKKIGSINLKVDKNGFFCKSQVPVFEQGLAQITSFEKRELGPEFYIEINNATQAISLKGAIRVLGKSKFSKITENNYKADVHITGKGLEADLVWPIMSHQMDVHIEADFTAKNAGLKFEAWAHIAAIDKFQEKIFENLDKILPDPLKKHIAILYYPISLKLFGDIDGNSTKLGIEYLWVWKGETTPVLSGEIELDYLEIEKFTNLIVDKIKESLEKAFAEVGEFAVMVWGQISTGAMAGANFVVGLGNAVGQGATMIAAQTQIYFQKGLEEAEKVIAVVSDKIVGTLEKANEFLEETSNLIVAEIIKFGYRIFCEAINPGNYS